MPCPAHSSDFAAAARVGPERRARAPRWTLLTVIALLGLHAVLAWTASLRKGPAFDESLQLAVGTNIWRHGDYRIEGGNGDFVKRWATLPYLLTRPRFVDARDPHLLGSAPYELGHRFLFELGNVPELLLAQARAMIAVLSVILGILVFVWSRALFGNAGGLLSAALCAFSPHFLAFAGTVSTDLSISLMLFAATACIWRLLHRVTPARLLFSLLVFGLLALAKPSALVILPIAAVLVVVKLAGPHPLWLRCGRMRLRLRSRARQSGVIAALVVTHAVAGWGAIWAHYGFRYAASPHPGDPAYRFFMPPYRDDMAAPLRATLRWLRENRIMPEGFNHGVRVLASNDDETVSFLSGEWTVGGRWDFFPRAFWAKSAPGTLILLVASLGLWIVSHGRRACAARGRSRAETRVRGIPSLYALAPLVTLIACYLAVALLEDLNIGHRHLLPIYPALYTLAGGVGLLWRRRSPRWTRILTVALVGWTAMDSFAVRPDYLAYFGPQVGGPKNGHRHLVDSSIDWGMDLPALREELSRLDPAGKTPVFLAYFGTDSPRYHGIEAILLPGFFDHRPVEPYALTPGIYAISATLLQSLYTIPLGAWSEGYERRYRTALERMATLESLHRDPAAFAAWKRTMSPEWRREIIIYDALRLGRLCAWLRHHREPDRTAGYSIHLYRLSLEELKAALLGPPVEDSQAPLPSRIYGRPLHIPPAPDR